MTLIKRLYNSIKAVIMWLLNFLSHDYNFKGVLNSLRTIRQKFEILLIASKTLGIKIPYKKFNKAANKIENIEKFLYYIGKEAKNEGKRPSHINKMHTEINKNNNLLKELTVSWNKKTGANASVQIIKL